MIDIIPLRVEVVDKYTQKFNGKEYGLDIRNGYYKVYIEGYQHTLHVDVWTYYNGKPPKGYHVHHCKEHSKNDNNIENLQLLTSAEHIRLHFEKREYKKYVCEWCGKVFKSKAVGKVRFCGRKCVKAWQYHSDTYKIERICIVCGNPFIAHKHKKKETCSQSCAGKLARQRRIAKEVD